MLVLDRLRPSWRSLRIHESSPAARGVSVLLLRDCPKYIPTQFFPNVAKGQRHGGIRCEDLEAQTFADESFDLVVTQDVMEHVFRPDQAHREIYRTLRPGGLHIHTVPIYSELEHTERCAVLADDGSVVHLSTPEYHGNPIDASGALVTHRYGRDLPDLICKWAKFSVEVVRFNDRYHGIVGAFTEVVVCTRR
jgi:SAM-dependent methyltransferase